MIVSLKILVFVMFIAFVVCALLSPLMKTVKEFFIVLLFIQLVIISSWVATLFLFMPLLDWWMKV